MHRRRRKGFTIDMTPLVDVAFLLLTFFMLTATFKISEGIAVDLPESRSRVKIDRQSLVLITLDAEGRIFLKSFMTLDGAAFDVHSEIGVSELQRLLNESPHKEKMQAVIQADRMLTYDKIAAVFDAVRTAGLKSVKLATQLHE
jgi:biopolymer transport protein ExbD